MKENSNRIIITGSSGMVGYYILQEGLKRGCDKIVLPLRNGSKTDMVEVLKSKGQFDIKIIDFNEPDQIRSIIQEGDIIVHCAAQIKSSDGDFRVNNIGLTSTLVNIALEKRVDKFIYLSSVAALKRASQKVTSELDNIENTEDLTEYAYSKYLAEMEVWRGHAEGLNTIILNPSQILGLGFWDKPNSRLWTRISEIKWFYPKGSLGLVDVRDVAFAVWECVEQPIKVGRIILNAEHKSYQDFFNGFRKNIKVGVLPRALPEYLHLNGSWLFKIFYLVKLRRNNPYSKKYLRQLMHSYYYDNSKSKEVLNINYRSIDESLLEIATLFLERGKQNYSSLE